MALLFSVYLLQHYKAEVEASKRPPKEPTKEHSQVTAQYNTRNFIGELFCITLVFFRAICVWPPHPPPPLLYFLLQSPARGWVETSGYEWSAGRNSKWKEEWKHKLKEPLWVDFNHSDRGMDCRWRDAGALNPCINRFGTKQKPKKKNRNTHTTVSTITGWNM